jgi:hypothetical protein
MAITFLSWVTTPHTAGVSTSKTELAASHRIFKPDDVAQ